MNILYSLAKNTFREAIRDRILYTIFFFGFLFLISAPLAGEISAGQEERLVTNFGIAMIHLFGLFITIFVGSRLIFNEIDKKTIYLLIPKPVPRQHIILSKFFGLGAVLFITTFIMGIVFLFLVPFSLGIVTILSFMYLSFLLLLAIVLFFSSFMSPLLASVSGILMFLIGNTTFTIKLLGKKYGGEVMEFFGNVFYYGLPNFTNLNLKNYVLFEIPYTSLDLFWITVNAILFMSIFLFFAILIFSRKQFH